MSLILDALNRSRQEGEAVPTLESMHGVPQRDMSRDSGVSVLQWALVAGLALAVIAIGWLLFDRSKSPAAQQMIESIPPQTISSPPPVPATDGKAGIIVPESVVNSVRSEEGLVDEPNNGQPEPWDSASQSANVPRPETPTQSEPLKEPVELPVVDPEVTALYEQPAPESPPLPEPEVIERSAAPQTQTETDLDIEALVAQAQEELANAELDDIGVPFLASLSQQTKDGIPSIMYQRHDYSGNPSQSSVVLNGQPLRKGQSVDGVKVVEILPDSSVLEFRATQFRLRALNSWVNL